MESIAKHYFSWESCFMNFGIDASCFLEVWGGRCSDFLGLENQPANTRIFGDETDHELWNWGW